MSCLFINVPLEKAITIAIKKMKHYHPKLTIDDENLRELFYYCTKRTNFMFNNEHYDQINGMSMGSSVVPMLAHLFISELEDNIKNFKGKKNRIFLSLC
jgi:hypothetical protein